MKKSGIIDEKLKLDHGNLLKKYENYALTNLNFGIDRVRYNVKGVFDKVIELYNFMKLDNPKIADWIPDLMGLSLDFPWNWIKTSLLVLFSFKLNIMHNYVISWPNDFSW